jgi:hypothetical protein
MRYTTPPPRKGFVENQEALHGANSTTKQQWTQKRRSLVDA